MISSERYGRLIRANFRRQPGAAEEYRIVRRRGPANRCAHKRDRQVDPGRRTITCGQCKAALDPFDCLLEMATVREHHLATIERLKQEGQAAAGRLRGLMRDERAARARAARRAKR